MPPDLALLLILISSSYPCLEHILIVPKVFEPLKVDCICIVRVEISKVMPVGPKHRSRHFRYFVALSVVEFMQ